MAKPAIAETETTPCILDASHLNGKQSEISGNSPSIQTMQKNHNKKERNALQAFLITLAAAATRQSIPETTMIIPIALASSDGPAMDTRPE
jgi:hypothetical protein